MSRNLDMTGGGDESLARHHLRPETHSIPREAVESRSSVSGGKPTIDAAAAKRFLLRRNDNQLDSHEIGAFEWRKNIYSYPPIGSPDGGATVTALDLDRFPRAIQGGSLQDYDVWTMLSELEPLLTG